MTATDEPSLRLVPDLLDRAERRWPRRPAVRDSSESLTYRELARSSRAFARWLSARGVGPGDRVLVWHPNCAAVVSLVHAAGRLGAALVPVSTAVRPFQLRSVVEDAAPALILAGPGAVVPGAPRSLVVPLAEAWSAVRADAGAPVRYRPDPAGTAFLMYTSGSTSTPKGVVCPHPRVLFAVRAIADRLGYRPDDAVFCRLPLSFDYGLYQSLLAAYAGSELLLPPEGEDARLMRWLSRWGATVVPVVPSIARMLVGLARRDDPPATVRLLTNTGATLTAADAAGLRKCFPGAAISPMFGITECKRIAVMEPDGDLIRPGSVGRPLDGTWVDVADERGRPLGPGEMGEFLVRGPHVMDGYWQAPDLTAQRFRRSAGDGALVLHTGDYGWKDEDGYMYFSGRRDDIFKRNGVRVSTTEIEAAAADVPGVRAAAVLAPDGDDPLRIVAVASCPPDAVLAGLRERLEPAKVPEVCVLVQALPLSPNGKTDTARLRRETA